MGWKIFTIFLWVIVALFLFLAEVVSWFIMPFTVIFFGDMTTGRLPNWAWWMETPTALLPGAPSIIGGVLERWGWCGASIYWLYRNSVYALADRFRIDPDLDNTKFWNIGNIWVNNDPYVPGYFIGTLAWADQWVFEINIVIPWPWTSKCFVVKAGWKLDSWFKGKRPQKPTATGMFQNFSPRPFLTRK